MLMNGVVNLATTLPSAPGYVGTFDTPGIEVLQLYGIPREIASRFDKRLKRLCGYGIYNGLVGHIDKTDPIDLLGDAVSESVLWDR